LFCASGCFFAVIQQGLKLTMLSLALLDILRSMLKNGVLQMWPYIAYALSKMA